jgi:hypothetical protein
MCCAMRPPCQQPCTARVHSIALLDSIHFRPRLDAAPGGASDAHVAYGTRTLSVLDVLLRHATEAREKTYSVPLAYWSFQRENTVVDGKEARVQPRLAYGGSHLATPLRIDACTERPCRRPAANCCILLSV